MRKISAEKLKVILENHKHWLNEDCEGWENMKADLSNAYLRNVNLSNADLRNAYLRYADLRNVNLFNADLSNAYLRYATNVPYIPMVCPEENDFIGWKKCRNDFIVKLKIPADAKRSSTTTRKCRCDKAEVLAIYNLDGTVADVTEVSSKYDESFKYVIGQTVEVKDFNKDRWNECSEGIHFFMNRQEAINYEN